MPRPRSEKVERLKERLIVQIDSGPYRPGDRFLSNRLLATRFAVSYQTAHRLLAELVDEGHLVRRNASGTYVPGRPRAVKRAQLVFAARAQVADSYGDRLLKLVSSCLKRSGLELRIDWEKRGAIKLDPDALPVLWDCPATLAAACSGRRRALLLDQVPPPELDAALVDSISVDNRAGGASAARLLLERQCRADRLVVFSGPHADRQNQERVAGFQMLAPHAKVRSAEGWFLADGLARAESVSIANPSGIFACNDRLAEALLRHYRRLGRPCPPLVGFDDAPVASQLDLTTIAMPWDELARLAAVLVWKRIAGHDGCAMQHVLNPLPVIRAT